MTVYRRVGYQRAPPAGNAFLCVERRTLEMRCDERGLAGALGMVVQSSSAATWAGAFMRATRDRRLVQWQHGHEF